MDPAESLDGQRPQGLSDDELINEWKRRTGAARGAVVDEPCRTNLYRTRANPQLWWQRTGHGSRYADAPPDDRSRIHVMERWGEDLDLWGGEKGTTPDTVGPWPPHVTSTRRADGSFGPMSREQMYDGAGAYDMKRWLRQNYLHVFEPEKVWLSDDEIRTLGSWLHENGSIFEEVGNDSGGVAGKDAGPGSEGTGRQVGSAQRDEGAGDRDDPQRPSGEGASPGEHADPGEGGDDPEAGPLAEGAERPPF